MIEQIKRTKKRKQIKVGILLLVMLFVLVSFSSFSPFINMKTYSQSNPNVQRFWQYQCFDTMKTSRDKARAWKDDKNLKKYIDKEMDAIVRIGGNCVAIATPYDEEFLPVLKLWVQSARNHNLHIWFRGNFSSWEGWFEYPKGMTVMQHHRKTAQFIRNNADLFKDGDIFTPSPEAENGGPFNQVEKDEHEVFRKYLIEEYTMAKDSFAGINKKVEVNWLSMNGGLGKRMFDQKTVDGVGKVVAIDHYIKTAPEMGEFIKYFKDNFNAKLVIGEFGAPIPEINGPMNEDEQAEFIGQLFDQLVTYRNDVIGINYWTLWDGSAALYNPDWTERKAVKVVERYMKPGLISGIVLSTANEPLSGVTVKTTGGKFQTKTDQNGYYELMLLQGQYLLEVEHPDYTGQTEGAYVELSSTQKKTFALIPKDPSLWYRVKTTFLNIRQSVFNKYE